MQLCFVASVRWLLRRWYCVNCCFCCSSLAIGFWFYFCGSAGSGELAALLFVHVHVHHAFAFRAACNLMDGVSSQITGIILTSCTKCDQRFFVLSQTWAILMNDRNRSSPISISCMTLLLFDGRLRKCVSMPSLSTSVSCCIAKILFDDGISTFASAALSWNGPFFLFQSILFLTSIHISCYFLEDKTSKIVFITTNQTLHKHESPNCCCIPLFPGQFQAGTSAGTISWCSNETFSQHDLGSQ